ncbi:hypothetical protein GCM10009827_057070 [Dactylosporangium maewongense]|uniref:Uncharacterized protein n=1 Tax=Dactylosporangium maewongense TaxID=634393 RepID=A0ABP4LUH1_9ACTN
MSGNTRLSILRPHDLLILDFELVNLEISADGAALVPQDAAAGAFVVVHFPPQALAETVWANAVGVNPPIRTAMTGPTRLVFRIPDGATVPLTTDHLLAWEHWKPVLAPIALPRGTAPDAAIPPPALPVAMETAIEFPWRLVLSPDVMGRWRTDNSANAAQLHQLWCAVLYTVDGDGVVESADVRALAALAGPEPFDTSLDASRRRQIVQLSSNFQLPLPSSAGAPFFTPVPLRAKRLELTTLGANAELEAGWDFPLIPPDQPEFMPWDLRSYQHTTALGRDHLVRTVAVGYLCGTGHRAVIIETIERLPTNPRVVGHSPSGGGLFGATGYLLGTTLEVVLLQPVVDYGPLAASFAHGGREMPLRSIRITTTSARIAPREHVEEEPFWLRDPDGQKLMFHAVGTDIAKSFVDFSLPLMFVPYGQIGEHRRIREVFDNLTFTDASTIDLAGQAVTYAPPGDKAGSTVLKTGSVRYDIEQPPHEADPQPAHAMKVAGAPPSYVPRFLPRVASLMASVPAVDDLLGTCQQQELVLASVYLEHDIDGDDNRAQTFVSFVQDLPLALSSQRGGGLVSPTSVAKALSRSLGPVSAPKELQDRKVDLSAFAKTRLLGTIPLLDLLPGDLPFDDAAAADTPVSQQQLDDPDFTLNPPRLTTRRQADLVETRFLWKPPLRKQPVGLPPSLTPPFLTIDLRGADLLLDATTRSARGGETSSAVTGRLRNATMQFVDALAVTIGSLCFHAESGKKMDVRAADVRIVFEGPLAFVNSLQSILPADGFDDPPSVTVDAQGVVAGYTLGVPSIGVGVFSLQNIALSAALSIPFTDRPAGVRFAICERHKPLLISVSLFGGGGFFAVGVSALGLEQVEAALEFGGNISLNLGIASGGVTVMAGIYFGMKGSSVELTGYLRCGGYLEVLGLISISLEFYLAFTYHQKAGNGSEVWGQASLTVCVKIAFISKSVTLSVERRFAGSGGDPSFAQSVSPSAWAGYLQSFA